MNTLSKQNGHKRDSLVRILAVAGIVMFASTNGFVGLGTKAAVRLPEEAVSLEPWLLPAGGIPPVVDTAQSQELASQEAVRRPSSVASPRVVLDRVRRQSTSRKEKQVLAEFMGLVGLSREEQTFMQRFEVLQSCRKFVAINC